MAALHYTQPAPDLLKLLAHDVRWQLLAALAESDRRVQELVALLERPQNLVSYHLRKLREGHVVTERRSSADGRDVYYSLDLGHLRAHFLQSGQTLHPALVLGEPILSEMGVIKGANDEKQPLRVLFLCTQNSARSQLAEGILRTLGGDLVQASSAGSEPGQIHPLAIKAAAALGFDISGQRSKHMDEFSGQTFDFVITVCDQVREVCPVFPDDPHQIHWSCPDPGAVVGSNEERLQAFQKTAQELTTRIGYLRLMMTRHQLSNREI